MKAYGQTCSYITTLPIYVHGQKKRGCHFLQKYFVKCPVDPDSELNQPTYILDTFVPLMICFEAYVLNWSVSTYIHIAYFVGGGGWSEVWRHAGPGPRWMCVDTDEFNAYASIQITKGTHVSNKLIGMNPWSHGFDSGQWRVLIQRVSNQNLFPRNMKNDRTLTSVITWHIRAQDFWLAPQAGNLEI